VSELADQAILLGGQSQDSLANRLDVAASKL